MKPGSGTLSDWAELWRLKIILRGSIDKPLRAAWLNKKKEHLQNNVLFPLERNKWPVIECNMEFWDNFFSDKFVRIVTFWTII